MRHKENFLEMSETKASLSPMSLEPERLKLLLPSSHGAQDWCQYSKKLRQGMEWSMSSEPWRHHYFWSFQLHEPKQFPSSETSFWLAFLLLATKILADSENKMASQRVSDQAATIQASSSGYKLSATRTALPLNKTWSLFECVCVCVCALSHVSVFASPWTVVHQAPLFIEFSKQEYWSSLPFPMLEDLCDVGIKPEVLVTPALAGRFFTTGPAIWEALIPGSGQSAI